MDAVETDVAVIGAGVVGLAVAAALARAGHDVIVLEGASAFGTVTSARNSEVIHAGLYYPTGSLKARLCVEGARMLYDWCTDHGVPHKRLGKLIVATDAEEAAALDRLRTKAADNGVTLTPLTGARAREMEPALSCVGALLSPDTGIVDSHALMLSYLGELEDHGGALALNTPVTGGSARPGGVRLLCGGAEPMALDCRFAVNCAGLGAQALAAAIEGVRPGSIPALHLAKGSYFDLTGKPPFARLIYPTPVNGGLGVHYTVDLGGRGRFGPDVEWLDSADPGTVDYAVDTARGAAFYAAVRRYWPGLPDGALQPAYAGVRPKLQAPGGPAQDFVVQTPEDTGVDGLFTLYGIESPGLTASWALARMVAQLIEERT